MEVQYGSIELLCSTLQLPLNPHIVFPPFNLMKHQGLNVYRIILSERCRGVYIRLRVIDCFNVVGWLHEFFLDVYVLFDEFGFVVNASAIIGSNGVGGNGFVHLHFGCVADFVGVSVFLPQHLKRQLKLNRYTQIYHYSTQFSFTRISVMSSLAKFIFPHISIDFLRSASAAPLRSFLLRYGLTIFKTSSLSRYSHTPSDAITINLSQPSISCSISYGSALVPALIPALSPKDLVIAKPGIITSFIHTRAGPSYSPFSLVWANTLPPNFRILCFQSGRSGFWSTDRGKTAHSYSYGTFIWLSCSSFFCSEFQRLN